MIQSAAAARISVIIPNLNEAGLLGKCVPAGWNDGEVIVADGGSRDGSAEAAAAQGWKVCRSAPNRAGQMNAGAGIACGDIFLFLHADTRLPGDFAVHVRRILSEPGVIAGAFRLRVDTPARTMRLFERVANWRSARLHLPYGDQALFLKAERFRAAGGFAELPILEDVELVRRLRRHGRIVIAPVPIITSARRWETIGLWKTSLLNQACVAAYFLGVPTSRIYEWYYGEPVPDFEVGEITRHAGRAGGDGWG